MRRQDVKHGVEYAVRVGSYGPFARILIIGEMTRETQAATAWRQAKQERGLEGKLIEGHYGVGFRHSIEEGTTGFVRGRDVSHTWELEEARKANDARLARERAAAKDADEAERAEFTERLKALGLDAGIKLKLDAYRGPDERIVVNRDALRRLIEMAEAGS